MTASMDGADLNDDNVLFGGRLGWNSEDWTASDDRVRGGSSVSHLVLHDDQALFKGNLDTETLGGAGFASQRTTGEDRVWDLSQYSGIAITFHPSGSDEKTYTFIVKDTLLPPAKNGREQSTVSWEFDFSCKDGVPCMANSGACKIVIPFTSFKPTYRGRPVEDTVPLAKDRIKRISLMMRSFFGTQSGAFAFTVITISGINDTQLVHQPSNTYESVEDDQSSFSSIKAAKTAAASAKSNKRLFHRFLCWPSARSET